MHNDRNPIDNVEISYPNLTEQQKHCLRQRLCNLTKLYNHLVYTLQAHAYKQMFVFTVEPFLRDTPNKGHNSLSWTYSLLPSRPW